MVAQVEEGQPASRDPRTEERHPARKGSGLWSVRNSLALLMHFSNFVAFSHRVTLSIAIVAMANGTSQWGLNNISSEGPSASPVHPNGSFLEDATGARVYDWSSETQGVILSAIFYGYLLTQIPGGYLAGLLGGKLVAGAGLLASSALTLLTPLASDLGAAYLVGLRVAQGMAQGVIIPAQFTLWAEWAPPLERSRLVNFSSAGISFGIFLTLIVGGVISHSLGWPSIFYIFGGVGCICCLLWFSLVYKDPQSHPFIDASEKEFITSSLTQQGGSHGRTVPISAMLTSLPLWAISVAFFSNYWLYITLFTSLPMYMKTVLHFNIREGGFLSSLPYIASWFSGSLVGILADLLLAKNICSLITLRKLFSALAMLIPSAFLVVVSYMDSNYVTAVILLTLSLVIRSLSGAGCLINHMDIAPRFAGFLQGVTSTFGTISGVITPSAVGFFTSQDASAGWRKVFFLSAAINLFGLIFYVTFGKVDIQDWARVELELR
ncbi:sodium-dependent phosphate transport protein 3-like [Tachyglossus aculeatus]|uniref:sodium-dependent phosphate transport protein 3-like n=1 Tax=Tachyglossus aculeatus TaxID=9261 RepID=UPI0018F6BD0F|nr:sodium-dependent phosphate transport protein 3-like [Tachyglossus aculeatus]